MTDEEVRRAAAKLVRPLEGELFYAATFGPLGRFELYIPEQPEPEHFETEWQEIFELVERIIKQRKAWRQREIDKAAELIAPSATASENPHVD